MFGFSIYHQKNATLQQSRPLACKVVRTPIAKASWGMIINYFEVLEFTTRFPIEIQEKIRKMFRTARSREEPSENLHAHVARCGHDGVQQECGHVGLRNSCVVHASDLVASLDTPKSLFED